MHSLSQQHKQLIEYSFNENNEYTKAYYASFEDSVKELKSVLSSKEKQKNLQTLDELINELKA